MNNPEFTPGPWKISGNQVIQDLKRRFDNWYTPQSHSIAIITGANVNNADARLIAAAPDLYEAAKAALAMLDALAKIDSETSGVDVEICEYKGTKELRAAIALAEEQS